MWNISGVRTASDALLFNLLLDLNVEREGGGVIEANIRWLRLSHTYICIMYDLSTEYLTI